MAVKLVLASGKERVLPEADGARVEGAFIVITQATRTLLMLLSTDVVRAEIQQDGRTIAYVAGDSPA